METETRTLAEVIAMQNDRNQRYVMLRHHEHNYDMGLRSGQPFNSLLWMGQQVADERADYEAFAATVDVAKTAYRAHLASANA